ncbi:MAG TPA: TraB/GumN family protein [Candidatus Limiplasma sp.]|nr:TraB/GumN family protein [Candidatus Limiplasma sp.]HRX09153.1 TraB/GumN family protein [Candidatus Limiplasma sp.]
MRTVDKNLTVLNYEDKEIILVGTAHVSKDSAALVKEVIEEHHPDSVCVELDEDRYQSIQNPKAWENTDVVKVIKTRKTGFLLASLALGSYQKRIAKQLNVSVGGEMLQGIESAKEIGAELVLADRNIQTTFLRIWRKLNLWEKAKLIVSLFVSTGEEEEITDDILQKLLETDILEAVLSDMRKQFPKIGDILISERDQYLAAKIRTAPGKKIVAVLGGAHVPGVKEEIFKEQNLQEITEIPKKKPYGKIFGWALSAAIIGLIVYGFFVNAETGLRQLSSWVLWNGGLAALFVALAVPHPLSILTAFVAAPITSLNPMLACGWFAGLTQAAVRKPTVQDVLNVHQDIFSFKGFFKNRFLKALVVVVLGNIGSSLGTYIAGIDIIKNLF